MTLCGFWRWQLICGAHPKLAVGPARSGGIMALTSVSHSLPCGANFLAIGSLLGFPAALLAAPDKWRNSATVHRADPFDNFGEKGAVGLYEQVRHVLGSSWRDASESNVHRARLEGFVRLHEGPVEEIAQSWTSLVGVLPLGGGEARGGVTAIFRGWLPRLRSGGIPAVLNAQPDDRIPDSDGSALPVEEQTRRPHFAIVRLIGTTAFATGVAKYDI